MPLLQLLPLYKGLDPAQQKLTAKHTIIKKFKQLQLVNDFKRIYYFFFCFGNALEFAEAYTIWEKYRLPGHIYFDHKFSLQVFLISTQ